MAYKNWVAGGKVTAAELMRIAKNASGDNISITYNGEGQIATVVDNDTTPATTYTFTWANAVLISITDGTNTWIFGYDNNNQLTGVVRT